MRRNWMKQLVFVSLVFRWWMRKTYFMQWNTLEHIGATHVPNTRPQITEILSGFWKINISLNITYKGLLNTFALKYQLCIISEWILNEKVRRMDGIRSCGNRELFSWASSCSGLSLLQYLAQRNQQPILGVSEIIHDIWGLFRSHHFRKRKSILWNEFRTFPSLCSGGDTDGMTGKFFIKVMLLKVKTCSNPGQNSG